MKIRYQAPRGQRIKCYGYCGISHEDHLNYSYIPSLKQWVYEEEIPDGVPVITNFDDCKSLRCAIRKIKHYNAPKGTKFILESRYVGHDIYITK